MMAVMGGMRSFWGPLLGAAVFVVLQDYLSSITVNWMSFVRSAFLCWWCCSSRADCSGRLLYNGASVHERSRKSTMSPKRFGNLVAVTRDVSPNVAKGEMCAILGPNGAGKTTFLQSDQRILS